MSGATSSRSVPLSARKEVSWPSGIVSEAMAKIKDLGLEPRAKDNSLELKVAALSEAAQKAIETWLPPQPEGETEASVPAVPLEERAVWLCVVDELMSSLGYGTPGDLPDPLQLQILRVIVVASREVRDFRLLREMAKRLTDTLESEGGQGRTEVHSLACLLLLRSTLLETLQVDDYFDLYTVVDEAAAYVRKATAAPDLGCITPLKGASLKRKRGGLSKSLDLTKALKVPGLRSLAEMVEGAEDSVRKLLLDRLTQYCFEKACKMPPIRMRQIILKEVQEKFPVRWLVDLAIIASKAVAEPRRKPDYLAERPMTLRTLHRYQGLKPEEGRRLRTPERPTVGKQLRQPSPSPPGREL